jgi:hypothetical protein
MAQIPDSLAFRFAVVLALAVIILAVTSWVAPPKPASDSAAPIPPTIYGPQHLILY